MCFKEIIKSAKELTVQKSIIELEIKYKEDEIFSLLFIRTLNKEIIWEKRVSETEKYVTKFDGFNLELCDTKGSFHCLITKGEETYYRISHFNALHSLICSMFDHP